MLEPGQTLSDRQDCLQVIRRNARHLLELINDILDISKIEAGEMTVEQIACDLPQLLADVVSMMRPRARRRAWTSPWPSTARSRGGSGPTRCG